MTGALQHKHCQVRVYDDLPKMSEALAQHCVQAIAGAIRQHGQCHLALTGGSTPKLLYTRLASDDIARRIDWTKLHVYLGDERYVPHDAPDSNFGMAAALLLNKVPLPVENIHAIPTQAGDARRDAQAYASVLTNTLPTENRVPVFDLILLGMGDDGHTASLFPGTSILQEMQQPVAAVFVEKLASWRISLTYPVLNAARCVMFMVSGKGKAARVRAVFDNDVSDPVPIQQVRPVHECYWYLDAEAAAELKS